MKLEELEFNSGGLLITPVDSILAAEVVIDDRSAFVIQQFHGGNMMFTAFSRSDSSQELTPDMNSDLYPSELDPVHKKNNFGKGDTIQKCMDHYLSLIKKQLSKKS